MKWVVKFVEKIEFNPIPPLSFKHGSERETKSLLITLDLMSDLLRVKEDKTS